MKKLFISQPMRGKSDEQILEERKKAVEKVEELLGESVEVIDSFFQGAPADAKPLWYLGESIKRMADADIVYFAPGWGYARGCRSEHYAAVEYVLCMIEDYSETTKRATVDFGTALELLKHGTRVTRLGWNGKGQSVALQKGYPDGIPCNKNTADAWGMQEGELFKCRPYFQLRCVDGAFQMWFPSVSDCLAEDWVIAE